MSRANYSIFNNAASCYKKDMSDVKRLFVAALEAKLKETGKSQAQVAREAGVTPRCINDILKGRRGGKEETKERIARVFGMSYDEFLTYGRKILEAIPEPFPGFEDIMSLPAKERFYSVWQLAAQHAGIQVALGSIGDPVFRDRIKTLETEEEVVQAYKEALSYWKKLTKRLDEELRKRGIKVETPEDAITVEAEVVEEKELSEGVRALPEGEK